MKTSQQFFNKNGYLLIESILTVEELTAIEQELHAINMDGAGSRELLTEDWCKNLANKLKKHPLLTPILPKEPSTIQCTFFRKSSAKNWLVPLHQDLSIPVKEHLNETGFTGWSEKQGFLFVQPPSSILEQIVAVRLHIDDCHQQHGPLKVVAGTHQAGRIPEKDWITIRDQKDEQECIVNAGGAVIMRPLILHSSSKAKEANGRRVLHFLFVPNKLTKEIPFLFTI
ncbi:phytanoyl-CoA dioxygenase family protein [Entomomonas sp. E2T0]|uniref:phytanoyl-CoA dioxygenase family protein n=1 Tax=Entomomonas sp. E2T0 TaxID=2930213 RepID=UPI002228297B|nr:phytanoyl-CoA dioxygenase family protein [Entomomonas sp. E2T0]UYZ84733.1 phytanoyl-CoA dioxygenase family protein [Entomomonas sp. E2T0]